MTKNIPDHALVIGNPGKVVVGWVDKLGNKLTFNDKGFSNCGKYILENILKKVPQ